MKLKLNKDFGDLKVRKLGITFEPSKITEKDYEYYYNNGFKQYFSTMKEVLPTEVEEPIVKEVVKPKRKRKPRTVKPK